MNLLLKPSVFFALVSYPWCSRLKAGFSYTYFQKETSVPIVIIAIEFLTYKGKSAPWWKYSPIRQPGPPLKLLDSVHIWEVFPVTLFQKSFVLSKNTHRAEASTKELCLTVSFYKHRNQMHNLGLGSREDSGFKSEEHTRDLACKKRQRTDRQRKKDDMKNTYYFLVFFFLVLHEMVHDATPNTEANHTPQCLI